MRRPHVGLSDPDETGNLRLPFYGVSGNVFRNRFNTRLPSSQNRSPFLVNKTMVRRQPGKDICAPVY